MTGIIFDSIDTLTWTADKMTELVRGNEQELIARLTPAVQRQNVLLDLSCVERIDAAGIAALISLYGRAHEAGHWFLVSNASARVEEILRLVGLDRILLSQNAVHNSHSDDCFETHAA